MHNFKKCTGILLLFCIFLGVNELLTYMLYPYTYTRADMHHLVEGDYETIIVGTSHGKCGLDPKVLEEITGEKTINACQGGQYPVDSYYLVREAARHRKLTRVIYELDAGYWVTIPSQSADFITFYHEMPWSYVKAEYFLDKMLKADFRSVLFPWYFYRKRVTRISALLEQKQSDVYKNYGVEPFDSEVQTYREDGFFARHPLSSDRLQEDFPFLWQSPGAREEAMQAFDKMAEFCEKEGIELTVVITPVPWVTYGKYQEHYDAASGFFKEYMKERKIPFYNYINDRSEGMPGKLEEFADYDGHMYEETAAVFSRVLGEDLANK